MHHPAYLRALAIGAWLTAFVLLILGTWYDSLALYVWSIVVAVVASTATVCAWLYGFARDLWAHDDSTWLAMLEQRRPGNGNGGGHRPAVVQLRRP